VLYWINCKLPLLYNKLHNLAKSSSTFGFPDAPNWSPFSKRDLISQSNRSENVRISCSAIFRQVFGPLFWAANFSTVIRAINVSIALTKSGPWMSSLCPISKIAKALSSQNLIIDGINNSSISQSWVDGWSLEGMCCVGENHSLMENCFAFNNSAIAYLWNISFRATVLAMGYVKLDKYSSVLWFYHLTFSISRFRRNALILVNVVIVPQLVSYQSSLGFEIIVFIIDPNFSKTKISWGFWFKILELSEILRPIKMRDCNASVIIYRNIALQMITWYLIPPGVSLQM